MPTISMFYGILVAIFYEDTGRHNKPHIHVRYQGKKTSISIIDGAVLAGDFPAKQLRMVQVWVDIHRDELMADWELAASGEEPFRITIKTEDNMEALLDVVSVTPQRDNTLLLVFENNEKRLFDMTPYLDKKPFIKLKGSPLFMKASIAYGTVIWPGNIDIAPETLWELSKLV